jgi:hypothetical protein
MNNLGNLINASYGNKKEKQSVLERKKVFKEDTELSTPETRVFEAENAAPMILHRGTTGFKDLGTDLMIGLGLGHHTKRLKDAKDITKKVETKYGRAANSYGDSLGGWIASNSNNHGRITTYNKFTPISDIGKKMNSKRQKDVMVNNDLVSLLGRTQNSNKQFIKNKGNTFLSAHSSANLFT